MFYPEPAFISAVVSLALLLPLPPLYQAGGMVTRQADVTAAGCGTDSAPNTSEEEGLGAEWQLHPARQGHKERAISADSVWTLSMVFKLGGGEESYGESNTYKHVTQNHTCSQWCKLNRWKKKCEKTNEITAVEYKTVFFVFCEAKTYVRTVLYLLLYLWKGQNKKGWNKKEGEDREGELSGCGNFSHIAKASQKLLFYFYTALSGDCIMPASLSLYRSWNTLNKELQK